MMRYEMKQSVDKFIAYDQKLQNADLHFSIEAYLGYSSRDWCQYVVKYVIMLIERCYKTRRWYSSYMSKSIQEKAFH